MWEGGERGGVCERGAEGGDERRVGARREGAKEERGTRRKARAKETQRRRRKPQHEGATKGERTLGPWGEEAEMRRATRKGCRLADSNCVTVGKISTLF